MIKTNNHNLDEKKQCLRIFTNNNRITELWGNGMVVIQSKVGSSKVIESNFLTNYIKIAYNEEQTFSGKIRIKSEEGVFGEEEHITLCIRKVRENYRKRDKIIISSLKISQLFSKEIELIIPHGELPLTDLCRTILSFAQEGYSLQKLQPIIQPGKKGISQRYKKAVLTSFLQYLKHRDELQPIICFKDYYGKRIAIFDDPFLAVEFDCRKAKTGIQIPNAVANLVVGKERRIVLVRDDQVTISTIARIKNSLTCNSSVSMTKESCVKILWANEDKPEIFKNFIANVKKSGDYRTFTGLAFYENMSYNQGATKDKQVYQKTLSLYRKMAQQGYSIPVVRVDRFNKHHYNKSFDFLVKKLFQTLLISAPQNTCRLFLQEAFLSNLDGTTFKSVDWYVTNLSPENSLERYSIELKSCFGIEKTRILQAAIAKGVKFRKMIPNYGVPVIFVDWKLNKQKWISYASRFSVILLDLTDLYDFLTSGGFFEKLNYYHQLLLANELKQQFNEKRSFHDGLAIIEHWKRTKEATKDEIKSYANYMEITMLNLLSLFRYLQVTALAPGASLYRYGKIPLHNPSALDRLHQELCKGTAIIVEEERFHITERIKKITTGEILPTSYKRQFQRRRQTFNLKLLTEIAKDLKLLLSHKNFWGKRFRAIGVKMLISDENQGTAFEKYVYRQFLAQGDIVIRHVAVLIGQHTRELDLVVFRINSSNKPIRILVSCSDCSHYTSKFFYAKKSIIQRLLNLQLLCDYFDFEFGELFIRVATQHQKEQVLSWLSKEHQLNDKKSKIRSNIVIADKGSRIDKREIKER